MRVNSHEPMAAASLVDGRLGRLSVRVATALGTVLISAALSPAAMASGGCAEDDAPDIHQGGEISTGLQDCPEGDTGDTGDTVPVAQDPPDVTLVQIRVGSVDAEGELCLGWETIWADQPYEAHEIFNVMGRYET